MSPKISIIMPIYNAAESLHRAINSIQAQTMSEWELIIVNDSSIDTSGTIADTYSESDDRIRVIHKPNEGVAMARQKGVDNAQGEYSIHVDADDWIEPTMLEELYAKAKDDDADVVICDYFVNGKYGNKLNRQQPSSLVPLTVLQDMFSGKIFGALWHKLIRTRLYGKYNAKFFNGINHCEDLLIWVQILQHPELKISYLPKAFYHYVINDNSITRNFTRKTYEMRLGFLDALKRLLAIPDSEDVIDKVAFSIFTEGIVFDVLNDNEIKDGLQVHEKQIKSLKSPRWKLGYFFLKYGFKGIAQKLIHY